MARLGQAWRGKAGQGKGWEFPAIRVSPWWVDHSIKGLAGRGAAWLGAARHGAAGQGKGWEFPAIGAQVPVGGSFHQRRGMAGRGLAGLGMAGLGKGFFKFTGD